MKHKLGFYLALLAVLLLAVAPVAAQDATAQAEDEGEPVAGGTLRAAWEAEWVNLDPHLSSAGTSFAVLANVTEALTNYDD